MSEPAAIPEHVEVLIIGGGPAGSYAASCLARENIQTCVIEAEKFPRYHVGESMMAALRHFLRFIDLEQGFETHGFNRKNGAAFKLNRENREGYTDFVSHDKGNYSWNLLREESDHLMLRHAATSGALVFEETRVTEVHFDGTEPDSRPISANWRNKQGKIGKISFNWLIDASGRAGIVSSKNLHNRKFNQSLKNIATWGYWRGTGIYSPTTPRAGSPWFEALTDESGWAWFIPLHNGTTSVGVVMNQEVSNQKKLRMPKENNSLTTFYHEQLQLAPDVITLIGEGTLVKDADGPPVRSASDYSYSATSYGGSHFRLAGDAAAFIDPFFSSGVHLAITSGLSAAATICASIRGDCTEAEAHRWHTTKVAASYTRFLVVVLAAYRQMHAQEHPVLSDVDEKNFDRAFEHFRPIIQGHSDVATSKHAEELRQTIDFCAHAFEPSEPEPSPTANGATFKKVGPIEDKELSGLDADSKRVFNELTVRGSMNNSDFEHIDNLLSDRFDGIRLRLSHGSLGLEKV
ncbi:Sulochrin halogenase [Hypsizygus marmoreus]|uniref:Sulochrin halogenase n=1 Tax=Hypsizygus marmoreus TaxID=39966 RepID=A0A369JSY8_HYPMA|nr:Sulochrin halogenase [Hypsizygus marmoreus]